MRTQAGALLDVQPHPAPHELQAAVLAAQRPHAHGLCLLRAQQQLRLPVEVDLACPAS